MPSRNIALTICLASVLLYIFFPHNENHITFPDEYRKNKRFMMLIAHPDDETMFFAPTLLWFRSQRDGIKLHLVSVTSGNSQGLGETRKKELFAATSVYNLSTDQVSIIDPEEQIFPDGFYNWDTEMLASALINEISNIKPDGIFTFDLRGVSGHPNHADCFRTVEQLRNKGLLNETRILALESVSLWRKYTGIFDMFYTKYFHVKRKKYYFFWENPFSVYQAMGHYRSQMLWFRYLYMVFSRYIYVNSYVEVV